MKRLGLPTFLVLPSIIAWCGSVCAQTSALPSASQSDAAISASPDKTSATGARSPATAAGAEQASVAADSVAPSEKPVLTTATEPAASRKVTEIPQSSQVAGAVPAATSASDDYSGPPTWFRSSPSIGAYGAPSLAYSKISHKSGVLLGVEGALLLEHRFALGLAGYKWMTETHSTPDEAGAPRNLEVSYAGAVIRYSPVIGYLAYGSVGVLVGAGTGTLVNPDQPTDSSPARANMDTFFVLEPQLSAHSNVTRWMRVTLQGGYRVTAGASRFGYKSRDYNGLTLGGSLQFGWF